MLNQELETPLNNIISQYKQLLQEDSEVYPIIFKTYSEITKSEKNTFNDSIARIGKILMVMIFFNLIMIEK